jgi:predicted outer membrane repeat protein
MTSLGRVLVAALLILVAADLLSGVARTSAQPDRYVATTGTDAANDCTNPLNPCATIEHAISQASDPDTIVIAAGTYTENELQVTKDLTFEGAGAATTIIQAAASEGTATHRVMRIQAGSTVQIDDVTIRFGSAGGGAGGGIRNRGDLTLNNVIVTQNESDDEGGGISNNGADGGGLLILNNTQVTNNFAGTRGGGIASQGGGQLTLQNGSRVDDNEADGRGGGIVNDPGSTVTLHVGSSVSGNTALNDGGGIRNRGDLFVTGSVINDNETTTENGGGISNSEGHVELTDSVVDNNTAEVHGGGIYTEQPEVANASLILTRTTVSNNQATTGSGGGIYNLQDHVELLESSVEGNTAAQGGGGGIYTEALGLLFQSLEVDRSTISGNDAFAGGGIFNDGDTVTLSNSTISGNDAGGGGGGGIYNTDGGGTFSLTNVTIAFNHSDLLGGNSGIHNDGLATAVTLANTIVAQNTPVDCSGPVSSLGNNLASDATCSGIPSGNANFGPLQDNGGPTETHALLPGSEAIDAGNDSICAAPPVNGIDQRGVTRPQDGDDDGTAVCDIGAFELAAAAELNALTISKVCLSGNGDGDADFNVLVSDELDAAVAVDALDCGEVMVVTDLEDGTYRIREFITGPNANGFLTAIVCSTGAGQPVTNGSLAEVELEGGEAAECDIINVFDVDGDGAIDPGEGAPPAPPPVIVPVDLDNTNTNTLDNLNENSNNNQNTNTQEQSNFQEQTNDNNQTTTVDSSPSVVIDFDE